MTSVMQARNMNALSVVEGKNFLFALIYSFISKLLASKGIKAMSISEGKDVLS